MRTPRRRVPPPPPEPKRERRPLCASCRSLGYIEPEEFAAWWAKHGESEIFASQASKPKPKPEEVEWAARASKTRRRCTHSA